MNMLLASLSKGDWIKVKFATDRTQNAVYHGCDNQGRVVVRKYRARSRSFTGPVKVQISDILEKLDRDPMKGVV